MGPETTFLYKVVYGRYGECHAGGNLIPCRECIGDFVAAFEDPEKTLNERQFGLW